MILISYLDMILKNNLYAEFIGDHLFYFTEETLKRVLNINGFDVIDYQPVWYDYILSAIVKKRVELNLSGFQLQKEKLKRRPLLYVLLNLVRCFLV